MLSPFQITMLLVCIVDAAQQYYRFGGFPLRIRPFVRDALLVLKVVSTVLVGIYLVQFLQSLVPGVMAYDVQDKKKEDNSPAGFTYNLHDQFMIESVVLMLFTLVLVVLWGVRDDQEEDAAHEAVGADEQGNVRGLFEPRHEHVDAGRERVRAEEEAFRQSMRQILQLAITLLVVLGLGSVTLAYLEEIMFAFGVAASEVLVDGNGDEHALTPLSAQSCGRITRLTSVLDSITAMINLVLLIMALVIYWAAENPVAFVDLVDNTRAYLWKAFKFLAISFAVMVNMVVVVIGCVFVVAPFMGLRCLWRCCSWLAGTICLIVPPLNRFTPIFGIEPLPTPYKKKAPKTDGVRSGSVCSNIAFSVILDQEEANKPIVEKEVPLDKKEQRKMRKRKVLKRTVSEWTIHVAADKERRLRTAVTRGYETDNESATVKKKVIVSKKRRMTLGGAEGTRGCWVAK